MNLTIRVDKILFSAAPAATTDSPSGVPVSPVATGSGANGATIHLTGPIVEESQHVKMGAYHTLDLEVGRDFTLVKDEGEWDSIGLDRVKEATEAGGQAEVGAVVCGEGAPSCHSTT